MSRFHRRYWTSDADSRFRLCLVIASGVYEAPVHSVSSRCHDVKYYQVMDDGSRLGGRRTVGRRIQEDRLDGRRKMGRIKDGKDDRGRWTRIERM